jgi:NADPH-dependent glutamate synthase beta subunit-like oxidoreductase
MTSVPGVFTAGDMQRGQSLIVWAIARALVTNPQLVLADEPTANLDHANAALVIARCGGCATASARRSCSRRTIRGRGAGRDRLPARGRPARRAARPERRMTHLIKIASATSRATGAGRS